LGFLERLSLLGRPMENFQFCELSKPCIQPLKLQLRNREHSLDRKHDPPPPGQPPNTCTPAHSLQTLSHQPTARTWSPMFSRAVWHFTCRPHMSTSAPWPCHEEDGGGWASAPCAAPDTASPAASSACFTSTSGCWRAGSMSLAREGR
jgi:hypothetical protein